MVNKRNRNVNSNIVSKVKRFESEIQHSNKRVVEICDRLHITNRDTIINLKMKYS